MDFSYRKHHQLIKNRISELFRTKVNPALPDTPNPQKFDRLLWKLCAEEGLLSFGLPESYTATPQTDLLTMVIALESIGYHSDDNGLPFALASQGCTIQHCLAHHGTEDQKKDYLPGCVAGDLIGAHAMTEPNAGSDSGNISLLAKSTNDGYLLNGEKHMISLAPVADFCVVFATIKPAAGRWGITAFIVDSDNPGFSVSSPVKKMGLDSVPMGKIHLSNCLVPSSSRLGPEGAGAAIAHHSLELERTCILASQVGRMRRQLEDTITYAKNRKQFGKSISEFQSVSNRLADMRVRLETVQLFLYKTAWKIDQGEKATLETSMLKLIISEHFLESSIDSMRTHGGYSYLDDHYSGRDTRDALGGVLYAGTSDIQRNIIAGLIGL